MKTNQIVARVTFKNYREIHSVPSESNSKISDVVKHFEKIYSERLGFSVTIKELTDETGFLYSLKDSISVLPERPHLVLVGVDEYYSQHKNELLFNKRFIFLERKDFVDDIIKSCQIGPTKYNGLFFQISCGYNIKVFGIIERGELTRIKGKKTLGTYKNNDVHMEISIQRLKDNKLYGVCKCKSGSDTGITTNKVELSFLDQKMIKSVGEVIIQEAKGFELKKIPIDETKYKQVITGKITIDETRLIPTVHEPTGNSQVELTLPTEKKCVPVNIWHGYKRDNKFPVTVSIPMVTLTNNANEKVSGSIEGEIQQKDGTWKKVDLVKVGSSTRDRYGFFSCYFKETCNFNLAQSQKTNIACGLFFDVTGCEPGRDNASKARIPKSLPEPLKIRLTIVDLKGKKNSVIIEKVNPPLNLTSIESAKKSYQNIKMFASVDEIEKEKRADVFFYIDSYKEFYWRSYFFSTSFKLDKDFFTKMYYLAKKENKFIKPIEALCRKKESFEIETNVIFSKDNHSPFAIKVDLKCSSGSCTKYVTIPFDEMK